MGEKTTRFIVMGCGHTGTTLVSGILLFNGFRNYNLCGDLENRELNTLCYRILNGGEVADNEISDFLDRLEQRSGGRWSLKSPHLADVISRINPLIKKPVKIIYHVRAPGPTVAHLLNERRRNWPEVPDAQRLVSAENEWLQRNRACLSFLDGMCQSACLITDYDEIIEGKQDELLCRFVGESLDLSFVEPRKRRSSPMEVSPELIELYAEISARRFRNNAEILQNYPVAGAPTRSRLKPGLRLRLLSIRMADAIYRRKMRFSRQKESGIMRIEFND